MRGCEEVSLGLRFLFSWEGEWEFDLRKKGDTVGGGDWLGRNWVFGIYQKLVKIKWHYSTDTSPGNW